MKPLLLLLASLLFLSACAAPTPQVTARLSAVEAINTDDSAGYVRVLTPRPFVFPRDHGPHPEYQIEWWYYTGNLSGPEGRHFGFQLTIFRRGLTPQPPQRDSAWASSNIYMAHLALSDVANGTFYAYERFSRDGAGLAGATAEPFRVFLEDWSVEGSGPEGMTQRLRAAEGAIALDLTLESSKPPVLQGDRGLSQKGPSAGNASYYYSLSRMATSGTVTVNGETYAVQGLGWKDREWSTSGLEDNVTGWDWFSIQLEDGRDMMFYQLRRSDGSISPFTKGVLSEKDGTTKLLQLQDVELESLATWRSPRTDTEYPSRWRLTLPNEGLTLELTPFLADQELPVTVVYWEGAVQVSGSQNGQPVRGHGYVELTGYAEQTRNAER